MVFSSPVFLFGFLPLFLGAYFLLAPKYRNALLFAASLFFYSWGEPALCWVMLLSLTSAYALGFPISKYRAVRPKLAKILALTSVSINLSFLIFFKYTGFMIQNLRFIPPLANVLANVKDIALPIGISFYTFQIISYTVDLWRQKTELQKNIITFGCYVTMFPQLVAGPIVKYGDVCRELESRRLSVDKFASGVRGFAVGLAKKTVIGDGMGALFAYFLSSQGFDRTLLGAWGMLVSYTLQIYFDFSGYSDMAIGLGRMLGFEFPENFNYPYVARSITDFWRRWHITLSSFFREYVYIPLGGNRCSSGRQYFNLSVVWLLTGLWHGASWNFILWGAYYLVLLIIEKSFLLKLISNLPRRLGAVVGHAYTLLFVGVGWLIFALPTIPHAALTISSLFVAPAFTTPQTSFATVRALPFILSASLLSTPLPRQLWEWLCARLPRGQALRELAECAAVICLFVIGISYTVGGTFSPFLYFNF